MGRPNTPEELGLVSAQKSDKWIHSQQADLFFGMWIVLNAIVLAVETDVRKDSSDGKWEWFTVDSIFNIVFLVEMIMRMCAERARWFKSAWNIGDFALVSIGVLDCWVLTFTGAGGVDVGVLGILRILRLMRLLRLLRVFRLCKELMLIIVGIASAMRAMVWGLAILGITIFTCSLFITRLIGKDTSLTDPFYTEYFGSMFRTSFTLLQFTMEFQPEICRRTWEDGFALTLFFIVYTCFTNLTILNIIGSIIVDTIMGISGSMDSDEISQQDAQTDLEERNSLKKKFYEVDVDGNGVLEFQELTKEQSSFGAVMSSVGVHSRDARDLFEILDADSSGQVAFEDLAEGIMWIRKPPQAKHLLQIERRLVSLNVKVDDSMTELLTLLKETGGAPRHGTCQQQKPTSMNIKVDDSMAELLTLLKEARDAVSHETSTQEKLTSTSVVPLTAGGTQDDTNSLLTTLHSELDNWRHDLTFHMEAYQTRVQELHTALMTHWEEVLVKYLNHVEGEQHSSNLVSHKGPVNSSPRTADGSTGHRAERLKGIICKWKTTGLEPNPDTGTRSG